MPFVMIPKALVRAGLTGREWQAYLALKYYAKGTSNACEGISAALMARLMNVAEDTMKRGLRELVERGIVKKTARSKKSLAGERIPMPNLYTILNVDLDEDLI